MRDGRKTALVTGGAKGIGAAAARLLARRGYAVAVNYKTSVAAARALVQELQAGGGRGAGLWGGRGAGGRGKGAVCGGAHLPGARWTRWCATPAWPSAGCFWI